MKSQLISLFVLFGLLSVSYADDGIVRGISRPNIVLIYVDDLGYSDLGCYGRAYGNHFTETPNIDQLAMQSQKFTNAYTAAPICSPARAALLTGKSPARLHFEFVTKWEKDRYNWEDDAWRRMFYGKKLIPPPYTLNLPLEEETLAEVLKGEGYATGMVGKWHVSSHQNVYNGWNPIFGPAKQGFDWTKDTFGAWDKEMKQARKNAKDGEFPLDALTDGAISYIRQPHSSPFFLYVSHYYVHTPLDADLGWLIDKYKAKAEREGLDVSDQRIRYAAFLETLDHYVGQLLRAIDDAGLAENTLLVFTSDNGGMPEFAYNRPLRGSKWNLYEGGIRIPLLVRWPGVVEAGTVSPTPVIQTDFLPTFYEVASGQRFRSTDVDGSSILSVLQGKPAPTLEDRSLVWHFPYYHPEGKAYDQAEPAIGIEDEYISQTRPHSAIQKNGYKLLYFYEDGQTELYNLHRDQKEETELSMKEQARANTMKEELMNYLKSVDARIPEINEQN